jgi:ABC-type uncharacterized transport system fused permease/ATPase subunit
MWLLSMESTFWNRTKDWLGNIIISPEFPLYLNHSKPDFSLSRIVASLVRGQALQFSLNILRWLLVAIPATWTNSWLSYIQSKLAIAYRTRLTKEILGQYLGEEGDGADGKVYYKLCEWAISILFGQDVKSSILMLQPTWTTE